MSYKFHLYHISLNIAPKRTMGAAESVPTDAKEQVNAIRNHFGPIFVDEDDGVVVQVMPFVLDPTNKISKATSKALPQIIYLQPVVPAEIVKGEGAGKRSWGRCHVYFDVKDASLLEIDGPFRKMDLYLSVWVRATAEGGFDIAGVSYANGGSALRYVRGASAFTYAKTTALMTIPRIEHARPTLKLWDEPRAQNVADLANDAIQTVTELGATIAPERAIAAPRPAAAAAAAAGAGAGALYPVAAGAGAGTLTHPAAPAAAFGARPAAGAGAAGYTPAFPAPVGVYPGAGFTPAHPGAGYAGNPATFGARPTPAAAAAYPVAKW